nr:hypothetical protein [Tanacetum cinerariifolium]
MIISIADNGPPMLEKSMYDSWKSRMELYIENGENGRTILNSVQNGPLGLPPDVYAIVNHHKVAKYIWDKAKLLMQCTKFSLQEKECKLYDEFDKFSFMKGETLYQYYWRFAKLINNINVINMSTRPVQVRDDPIACLNKAMDFLSVVATSRFPSTNNQLRTSSNLRNQATIQDGKVTVQQVQMRKGHSYVGTDNKGNATSSEGNKARGQAGVVKCYNFQGEGHMARQCT